MTRLRMILLAALLLPVPGGAIFGAEAETEPAVKASYLEGLVFRNIGPWRGGRVTAVAGVASDTQVYYMGSTGGVFKTTNAGVSWEPVDTEGTFGTGSVGAIDVAASDPNVVLVGMGESPFRGVASSHGDGVYRSTDAGKTWKHLGLENSRQISAVKIHPTDPDTFWVAVQGSPWAPTPNRGVYRTTDGGETWEKTLYVDETSGAVDLEIDTSNPRILYAALWDHRRKPWEIRSGGPGSGLWKSPDGGVTWEKLTQGLPEEMGKIGVAPSPSKPERVWAVVEAKDEGGVYRSDDGGETWKRVNETRQVQARSWYYMHLFADPQDENTVYVQNSPFLKSVDGGKTFTEVSAPHVDHHDLWINPHNNKIIIDGNDGGANITFDGGESWSTQHNQPTAQFYRVNVDNAFAYKVYGGQQDNTTVAILSRASDGRIGREDYHSVGGCESAHIAFDPDDPRYIYAGCYLGLISEYDSETRATRDIRVYPELAFGVPPRERKYRFNWNAPIVVSGHDPTVIYHAGNVVLRSIDRGLFWQEVSPDLTRDDEATQGPGGRPITNEVSENYNTLFALTESPTDPDTLWAGSDDGLIHLTRDGGETWNNITPEGVGVALINTIEVSPHDSGTAYVAVTRYKLSDHTPLIYKTSDYGGSWSQIAGGIPAGAFVGVAREDPEREGLLFAGTEVGLFVSWDDGGRWQPLQHKLPVVPITDLRVHRRDLVLSTQGRALWVLDDISPLRQMSAEIQDAAAHLFAPEVAYRIPGGGFDMNAGRGENPPGGAILYYSLAQAPDLKSPDLEEAAVRLEILNADGEVLRTLTSDAEKGKDGGGGGSAYALPAKVGLNRALWDLRTEALVPLEGVWTASGGDDNKIDGFTVGPGTYTVRLTVGEATNDQPLEVRWDPRLPFNEGAAAEQADLTARAYAMVDELQRSVLALRKVRDQVQTRIDLAKDGDEAEDAENPLATAGEAVVEAVEEWEGGLINTKREFFQDVLNWPDKLHSHLQGLSGDLDGQLPPLTEGLKQRFEDLKAQFDAAMADRDAVVEGPVAAFNEAFEAAGEPGVRVPEFTDSEE